MSLDLKHVVGIAVVVITAVVIRLSVCLPMFQQKRRFKGTSLKTLIVFGSGMYRVSLL